MHRSTIQPSGVVVGTPKHAEGIDQSCLPIFNQDWWTNIAREPSNYLELKVVSGKVVVGRFPIVLTRNRVGLVQGHDPHWSHLGGPVVDESLSRAEQADVLEHLLDQLPRWTSFSFVCNPASSYADLVRTAFRSRGFLHSTQLTFVRHPADGEVLCTRKSKHKGHFRRAARDLECLEIDAREFVHFFEANLKTAGKKSYSPLNTLIRLIEEGTSRGQARAIAARPTCSKELRNGDGAALYDAAIVYVWDSERCYYWLSTKRVVSAENSTPRPHPDAIKLLAAKAMEDARSMKLIFDADGVTTPGTENLYRNMLGLKEELRRDVFHRVTYLEQLHQMFRQTSRLLITS